MMLGTPVVKTRRYRSEVRAEAALATRRAILTAARKVLVERGYAAMTMQSVAAEAGVALDTVYAAVGKKAVLVALLIETAISGEDEPVPAEERDYVIRIRAAEHAADKLTLYASAVAAMHERLAPIVKAIQGAGSSEPEIAKVWKRIADRRARNMRALAEELLATGELRRDLGPDDVRDVLWATNAPEMFLLFVHERGWSPEKYGRWLADAWRRLFLA